jgi:hypothetical protein
LLNNVFDNTDVLGKVWVENETMNYQITGMMQDIPAPPHFRFDFL